VRRGFVTALVALLTGGAVLAGLPAVAGGEGSAAPQVLPTLPPLPLIEPSPSPSPKPKPMPAPPRTAAPQDRWALVVGVTDYRGNVQDTVGGANDARLVRDVLLRNGWRDDRIRVLTDGAATGQAVADGISWLQRNSSSRTFSFFHYSGHVKQKNGHEHLWPVDNRYLVDTEVARVLRAIRGTAWTSISACEAGGFDEGLSSPRHLFTASSHVTEKSYEDRSTGYSVWSGMLFDEGLRQKAADRDGDGGVSVNEAYRYAAPRARSYTRDQRPHGPQTPQWAGGNGSLDLAKPRV
jgi:hypothetical protein